VNVNGEKYSAQVHLSHLLTHFPLFTEDFPVLEDAGIIERTTPYTFKWTKSNTSLAEYFIFIGNDASDVPEGFWSPVENVFTTKRGPLKRGSLTKLASRLKSLSADNRKANAIYNTKLPDPVKSQEFKKIENLVEGYRKQEQKDRKTLTAIKTLICEYEKGIYEYDEDGYITEVDITKAGASKVLKKIKNLLT
jgi:hypothetical protein